MPIRLGARPSSCAAGADEANGALGVAKLNRVMVARSQSGLEDEGGHAPPR